MDRAVLDLVKGTVEVVMMDLVVHPLAHQFLGLVAEHLRATPVDEDDLAGQVRAVHPLGSGF